LTREAANALLKTLEEPPGHAIFVLATTEIHKMIPTIISRCQRFDFRKLTVPEIIKRLEIICQKEEAKIEKAALELVALNAAGSIRDGESLLDEVLTFAGERGEIKAGDIKDLLGLVEIELVAKFCDFLCQKKASEAINFLNEIIDRGSDLQEFAKILINYLRQALILKMTGATEGNPIINRASEGSEGEEEKKFLFAPGLTKEEFQKLQTQAASFKEGELRNLLNLFLEAENKMKYSPIPQLPLELAIIESCGVA